MKGLGVPGHVSYHVGLSYIPMAHGASRVPGFSPPPIAINMQQRNHDEAPNSNLGASVGRSLPTRAHACQGALPLHFDLALVSYPRGIAINPGRQIKFFRELECESGSGVGRGPRKRFARSWALTLLIYGSAKCQTEGRNPQSRRSCGRLSMIHFDSLHMQTVRQFLGTP